jgi:hypothetical protein
MFPTTVHATTSPSLARVPQDDSIQVSGSLTLPTLPFGGDGNDTVKRGKGNNILIDGDSNDTLTGGNSRDIVIGGTDADTLTANDDDDILIADTTDYDANAAALGALMKEWGRTDESYSARVNNLLNGIVSGGQTYAPERQHGPQRHGHRCAVRQQWHGLVLRAGERQNKDQLKDKTSGEVITGL